MYISIKSRVILMVNKEKKVISHKYDTVLNCAGVTEQACRARSRVPLWKTQNVALSNDEK